MRITTKGRYALRAITNLALAAEATPGKPKAIKNIAAEEEISPEFLEQIFFKMKKAGIIESIRGPGGGFTLTKNPGDVNVKDIFLAVDEGLDLTPCTTCGEATCAKVDTCLVHDVWREASEHINRFFESMSLKKIMENSRSSSMARATRRRRRALTTTIGSVSRSRSSRTTAAIFRS